MSKIVIALLLSCSVVFGQWNKTQDVKLIKDEPYRIVFHEALQNGGGTVQREFVLRWTLFANEGLTVTIKYDRFNHHHVLFARRGMDSFHLELLPKVDGEKQNPYMLIVFKEFDDANQEAYFELFIKDNDRTNMQVQRFR